MTAAAGKGAVPRELGAVPPTLPPEPSGLYQRQLPSQGRRGSVSQHALELSPGFWELGRGLASECIWVTERPQLTAYPDQSTGAANSPRNIQTGIQSPEAPFEDNFDSWSQKPKLIL